MDLETLSAAQRRLGDAGFTDQLVAEGGALRAVGSARRFDPGRLAVLEVVRFEGDSDPGDEAILFAVATAAGEPVGTYTVPYGPATGPDDDAIIHALHRPPLSEDDIGAHQEHDHIAAVFPTREAAEAAVDDLRQLGLGSAQMGVAVHQSGHAVFERDAEAEIEHDTAVGIGAGVAVGFMAGFALVGLAIPGIGAFGVGGLLALGAAAGFGGGMIGGYLGVAAGDHALTVHEQLAATPLGPDEVEQVLQRNGGRLTAPDAT